LAFAQLSMNALQSPSGPCHQSWQEVLCPASSWGSTQLAVCMKVDASAAPLAGSHSAYALGGGCASSPASLATAAFVVVAGVERVEHAKSDASPSARRRRRIIALEA
jgi:hypothetical protein